MLRDVKIEYSSNKGQMFYVVQDMYYEILYKDTEVARNYQIGRNIAIQCQFNEISEETS